MRQIANNQSINESMFVNERVAQTISNEARKSNMFRNKTTTFNSESQKLESQPVCFLDLRDIWIDELSLKNKENQRWDDQKNKSTIVKQNSVRNRQSNTKDKK